MEVAQDSFVAPAPAVPLPKLRTPSANPYDTKTTQQIKTFYKLRRKQPLLYRIGEDANLQTVKKDGTVVSSIQLKNYRNITVEEREAMESERIESLAALDVIFEAAKRELREAYKAYKETGAISAVLLANKNVEDIELQRVDARSSVRGVKDLPNPRTRDVLFDQPYEERKLFGAFNLLGPGDQMKDGIFQLERRNFPASLFYGRYEVATAETAAAAGGEEEVVEGGEFVKLTTGGRARLFYDPKSPMNSFLSPLFVVDFVYKETRYSSPFQAYECERMVEIGKPERKIAMLKTRSVNTIKVLGQKEVGQVKDPQGLWSGILNAVYDQHPELVQQLLSTGQDKLVYANPEKGAGGVGLVAKDKKILDPKQWQDTNVVGKILEMIRAQFRESDIGAAAAPPPEVKESTISVEQQTAAKKGAIISQRRK
jgi:predicted NAD-dependent protein-ADP-ribosyltransferase YbiA (DUF1768 family)